MHSYMRTQMYVYMHICPCQRAHMYLCTCPTCARIERKKNRARVCTTALSLLT